MGVKSIYHREERLNAISHAVGALLALIGMYFLLHKDSGKTPNATFTIVVYGCTLISMFVVSALYHMVATDPWKTRYRILDHINIYFLIAGTYSPVALITLVDGNGWLIFKTVWGIAFFGAMLKIFLTGRYEVLSLVLYLAMGWLIVLDFENLLGSLPERGLYWLMAGGAFYTLGILFYVWERLPYNHFLWHLFVLGGAISHWVMIYGYVI